MSAEDGQHEPCSFPVVQMEVCRFKRLRATPSVPLELSVVVMGKGPFEQVG